MSEDNLRLRFEILEDGEVAETRELDRDVVKIGKLASSHLRLDEPSVSRIHAVIERSGDGSYSVIDLGSAEGTFVDGEQVTKSEVESGDELAFGEATVRLEFVDAEESGAEVGGGTPASAASAGAGEASAGGDETEGRTVTTDDGREVEPYTLEGYYDDGGNYIPGYYDEEGEYHLGYGYYDDRGEWRVAYGYYNPRGEWVSTEEAVESVPSGSGGEGAAEIDRPSDREEYTRTFFDDQGGKTLEVAQLWGDHVLAVTSFNEGEGVTIGPGDEADFQVGEGMVPGDEVELVSGSRGRYRLTVTDEMRGHVRRGEKEKSIREMIESGEAEQHPARRDAYAIALDRQSSARVEVASNTFLIHFTEMPRKVGGAFSLNSEPLPYQAISAAAHIAFLLMCMTLPGDAGNLNLEKYSDKNRFVEMMVKPEQKKKKKPDWMKEGSEEAAKHKGEETKAGKEDTEKEDNKMAIKGPPDNKDLKLKKKRNKKIAMNAGLMKSFQQNQVASKWGSAEQSVGSDAIHALGNLEGDNKGTAKGFGGLGLEGAGRGGGGGMSESGLGIGNVGSGIGGGGGRGGTGYGEGKQDLGEKADASPEVVPKRPAVVEGALDKEIVRKVVRQHRREIKYCYEKELAKDPTLKGEVTVQFTISASGEVIAALVTKSTLGNQAVETCMQGKIQRWTFPEPKGSSIVKVNYPFNFSPQN